MKVLEHYWEHSKEVNCDGQEFQPRREGSGKKKVLTVTSYFHDRVSYKYNKVVWNTIVPSCLSQS